VRVAREARPCGRSPVASHARPVLSIFHWRVVKAVKSGSSDRPRKSRRTRQRCLRIEAAPNTAPGQFFERDAHTVPVSRTSAQTARLEDDFDHGLSFSDRPLAHRRPHSRRPCMVVDVTPNGAQALAAASRGGVTIFLTSNAAETLVMVLPLAKKCQTFWSKLPDEVMLSRSRGRSASPSSSGIVDFE